MVQATPETEWVEERLQNYVWLLFLQKHSLKKLLHLVSLVSHNSLTGIHVSDELFFFFFNIFLFVHIYTYVCMYMYLHAHF